MITNCADSHSQMSGRHAGAEKLEEWQGWIFECLAQSLDEATLVDTLVRSGFTPAQAQRDVDVAKASPYLQSARRSQQRLRKLESLFAIKQDLAEIRSGRPGIERRSQLSREEFRDQYFATNQPVVICGALRNSAAFNRWSPEYLAEACGDVTVEVMGDRNRDPDYEINCDSHRQTVTFAEYVDRILRVGPSNDCYLVANNGFLDKPQLAALRAELPQLPQYLDPAKSKSSVFLWFGPAGTVTPLHHDTMNILVAQITGRKRFTLISPEQTPLIYNHVGVYSAVDCEAPDLQRHPLFSNVSKLVVELAPGEMLFIPVGWWHHVRALQMAINVSYTNFLFPNCFQWTHPGPE